MSVFAVMSMGDGASTLEAKIASVVGEGSRFLLRDDVWLVAYDGTTQLLAEKLGIRSGESQPGIVLLVSNFSGRASPDIWAWLVDRLLVRAG